MKYKILCQSVEGECSTDYFDTQITNESAIAAMLRDMYGSQGIEIAAIVKVEVIERDIDIIA